MDLYKLKTFRTAGVFLNFNKAAIALNCAQSTVSAQIRSLEEEVGTLLFKRIKKKVVLTEAGEKMLVYANQLLAIEEEALADITSNMNTRGTIRLMVPEAFAANHLPVLIQAFLTSHPNVNFDISNCSQGGLEYELRSESVDLAFIYSDSIDSVNLNSEKVLTERLILVTGPNHPLAGNKAVDVADLHSQTIFLPKAGCGYGLLLRQLLNTDIAWPSSILEFTSIEAIKKCVLNDIGVAVLPAGSVQEEVRTGRMAELNGLGDPEISVAMIWHKTRSMSDILREFMALARNLRMDQR